MRRLTQARRAEAAALLRSQRLAKGLTLQQLSDRAHITQRQVERFETGERCLLSARYFTATRVLEALDIDVKTFCDGHTPAGEAR